jgi:uncharacterized membrane protein YfcA
VVLVAIPHFAATLLRAWRLRHEVDRTVLLRVRIASAAGGLIGASLHNRVESTGLAIVFGCLRGLRRMLGSRGFWSGFTSAGCRRGIAGILSVASGGWSESRAGFGRRR